MFIAFKIHYIISEDQQPCIRQDTFPKGVLVDNFKLLYHKEMQIKFKYKEFKIFLCWQEKIKEKSACEIVLFPGPKNKVYNISYKISQEC